LANRKKGNRRLRLREKRIACKRRCRWYSGGRIWLALHQDASGTYHIRRYGKVLDGVYDRGGKELFSSSVLNLVFEHIQRERYLKHPSLVDKKCSEVGIPQASLRRAYQKYCKTLEEHDDPMSSSEQSAQL